MKETPARQSQSQYESERAAEESMTDNRIIRQQREILSAPPRELENMRVMMQDWQRELEQLREQIRRPEKRPPSPVTPASTVSVGPASAGSNAST